MNISLIIFCYNELGSTKSLILSGAEVLKAISINYEIIVIDDGSTDGSADAAEETARTFNGNVRVVKHAVNLGIGMALRTGYSSAKYEYVCAVPGDGQFNVQQLYALKQFDDTIYYSFYRVTTNYTFYRNLLTWLNRLFNQHVLGIYLRDVNWVKVYRKSQLEMVNPELKSSLIESEICAKLYKRGVMPLEIPSEYLSRTYGTAKGGNWKTLRKAIRETWKLFYVVHKPG